MKQCYCSTKYSEQSIWNNVTNSKNNVYKWNCFR